MGIAVLLVGVLLTLLALPRMAKAGCDAATASGLVAASGTAAILMPPSVMLIVPGDQLAAPAPAPQTFAGAVLPGLPLAALSGAWTAWRARELPARAARGRGRCAGWPGRCSTWRRSPWPHRARSWPESRRRWRPRGRAPWGRRWSRRDHGRLSGAVPQSAARDTAITTSMVIQVIAGAILAPGFVLDRLEITLILAPVVAGLDFGNGVTGTPLMVWFGILVAADLQTSFLTPPFGFALFYLRGGSEGRVPTGTIYRGVAPFAALQLAALGAVMAFPWPVTG